MRLAFAVLGAALALATPELAQSDPAPQKIILVGDSTVAVGSGWGGAFCDEHVISALACLNLAREGRSTASYRADGSWDLALSEMSGAPYAATWVLIQFGHNDQPGKRVSTDLATTYPDNLRRFIAEVRQHGARPILVTPLVRRRFIDGELDNTLAPWADAVRRIGAETDTPVIDLNAASAPLVQAMGALSAARLAAGTVPEAFVPDLLAGQSPAAPLALRSKPGALGRRAADFDYTHLGPDGAALFADLVAAALIPAAPDLAPLLVP